MTIQCPITVNVVAQPIQAPAISLYTNANYFIVHGEDGNYYVRALRTESWYTAGSVLHGSTTLNDAIAWAEVN